MTVIVMIVVLIWAFSMGYMTGKILSQKKIQALENHIGQSAARKAKEHGRRSKPKANAGQNARIKKINLRR